MKVSDKFLQKVGFPYILEHLPVQSPMGEICKRNLKPYAPAEKERLLEELALVTWALERLDTPAWNKLLQELMLLKDVSGSLKRLESGELTLAGEIVSMAYSEPQPTGSVFSRIFR